MTQDVSEAKPASTAELERVWKTLDSDPEARKAICAIRNGFADLFATLRDKPILAVKVFSGLANAWRKRV